MKKNLDELTSILKNKGFIGEIIECTPDLQRQLGKSCRGYEIKK